MKIDNVEPTLMGKHRSSLGYFFGSILAILIYDSFSFIVKFFCTFWLKFYIFNFFFMRGFKNNKKNYSNLKNNSQQKQTIFTWYTSLFFLDLLDFEVEGLPNL